MAEPTRRSPCNRLWQGSILKKEEVNIEKEKEECDDDDLIPWGPHIEHDVADEVVVEGKSCLVIMTIKTVMIVSHHDDDDKRYDLIVRLPGGGGGRGSGQGIG